MSERLRINDSVRLQHIPCEHGVADVELSLSLIPSLAFRGDCRLRHVHTRDLRKSLLRDGYREDLGLISARLQENGELHLVDGGSRLKAICQIAQSPVLRLRARRLRWIPFRIYDLRDTTLPWQGRRLQDHLSQPLLKPSWERISG